MKLTQNQLRQVLLKELEKSGPYAKYNYGIDSIKDKTQAHDDIIGHT